MEKAYHVVVLKPLRSTNTTQILPTWKRIRMHFHPWAYRYAHDIDWYYTPPSINVGASR